MFCCKLFKSVKNNSLLANESLNDWKHIMTKEEGFASKMEIDFIFSQKHRTHKKKQFDRNCHENSLLGSIILLF